MTIKEFLSTLGGIAIGVFAVGFVPFMLYVVFPYFQSLSPERKFEKYVDEQCLQGNEVAIRLRREGMRFYTDRDYQLVRAAIEGNEHAVKALKLDLSGQKFGRGF